MGAVRDCFVLIGTSQIDWRQYPTPVEEIRRLLDNSGFNV